MWSISTRLVTTVALALVATMVVVVPAPPAQGLTEVTWVGEGTIDRVDFDLEGLGIDIGDPFRVTFTFDADDADASAADATRGDYYDLIGDIEITIGDLTYTRTGTNESYWLVFDGWNSGDDVWDVRATNGWAGPALVGEFDTWTPRFLQQFLLLRDDQSTVFSSDALLTTPPALDQFESKDFHFAFVPDFGAPTMIVGGELDALYVEGQEPSTDADLYGTLDLIAGDVDADGEVPVGTEATYRLRVGNLGPEQATDVKAVLWLPSTLQEADVLSIPTFCAFFEGSSGAIPGQLECDIGDLAADVTGIRSGDFQLRLPFVGQFEVSINRLESTSTDPNSSNDTDLVSLDVRALRADLRSNSLVVAGDPDDDSIVTVGSDVTFSVSASNDGPDPATNTRMLVWLPGDVTESHLAAVPLGCTFFQGGLTLPTQLDCDLGTVAVGLGGLTIRQFTVTMPSTGPFTVGVNTLTSDEFDPDTANNMSSTTLDVRALLADLSSSTIVVSGDAGGDGVVPVGTEVTFSATAFNSGPDPATNTRMVVWLPGDVSESHLDAVPLGCSFFQGGLTLPTQLDCDLGTVGTGVFDFVGRMFTVTMPSTGPFTVGVNTLTSDEFDPDTANNMSSTTLDVRAAQADLRAGIDPLGLDGGPASLGVPLTYAVSAENLGPDAAPGTTLEMRIFASPAAFELGTLPLSCSYDDTASPPTVTCDADLAAPDGGPLGPDYGLFFVPVTWLLEGNWQVSASAAAPAFDPVAANDTASSTVEVVGAAADLTTSIGLSVLSDVDQDGDMWQGHTARYSVTVANLGPDPAPNTTIFVMVHADEGADFSFVSSAGCERAPVDLNGDPTYACDMGEIGTGVFDFRSATLWLEWNSTGTFDIEAFATSDVSDPNPSNSFSTLSTVIQAPNTDIDGDGIANSVDGLRSSPDDFTSFVYLDFAESEHFSDQAIVNGFGAGTTFGDVLEAASTAAAFDLFDAPDPLDGVTVAVVGDPTHWLSLAMCGTDVVNVFGGTVATLTCGSVTVEVTSGVVTIELNGGAVLEIGAGSTVTIDDADVEVVEGSAVLKDGDVEVTIDAGETFSDPGADADGDGLSTIEELRVGTDPDVADTDGDGVVDGLDVDWLVDALDGFHRRAFANNGAVKAMISLLGDIDEAVRTGDLDAADDALAVLAKRADGCGDLPDSDDWIVGCTVQSEWRLLLDLFRRQVGEGLES